jgi:hypothetical protein
MSEMPRFLKPMLAKLSTLPTSPLGLSVQAI